MAHYFDLHLHPVFKQGLSKFERTYPSERKADDLARTFQLNHGLPALIDEELLHFLKGQCSAEQLKELGPSFGSASIVTLERFATHRTGIFGKLLNGAFTDPFDKDYLAAIRDGEVSYYQLFVKELSLYRTLVAAGRMRWITRRDRTAVDAADGLNMTLSMEGGHSLCRSLIGRPGWLDARVTPPTAASDHVWKDFNEVPATAAQSLKRLQQALWDDGLDLMYITLTHLSHIDQQLLATHAFGMKMLNTWEIYPQGGGLTEMGRDVVKAAYELEVKAKDGNREVLLPASVMIDIKHMGLKARLDLYAYRRQLKAQWELEEKSFTLPPILATHMGVTGYSLAEWKEALKPETVRAEHSPKRVAFTIERQHAGDWGSRLNRKFTYNAWTVNLMDEDIVEVLDSGGLIGISLDVRILGWNKALNKEDVEEYMSAEEFRHFFPSAYERIKGAWGATEAMGAAESWLFPTPGERQPLAFCFNLLHVISVGLSNNKTDVWDRVCIGSDYDGLIDPVVNASDASELGNWPALLRKWLPVAEEAYRKVNGGPQLLTQPVDTLINKLMHENGRRFLRSEWK